MKNIIILLICLVISILFVQFWDRYVNFPGGLGEAKGFPFTYYKDMYNTREIEFDQPIYKYLNILFFFSIFSFISIKSFNNGKIKF